MIDVDRSLRDLAEHIDYPETPDLVPAVMVRITAPQPAVRTWWRPALATALAVAAVVVLVVALIPAAREEVASWLGIRGVVLERAPESTAPGPAATAPAQPTSIPTPPTTAPAPTGSISSTTEVGIGLDLGAEITLQNAASRLGFTPLLPSVLGEPDAVFVDAGRRLWLLYDSGPGLPETAAAGIGAIVTEFRADEALGIAKQVLGGPEGAEFVEVDGAFGVWIEGPHPLLFPELEGSAVQGRSAGNTLLWEGDEVTLRLETALTLDAALEIARSFE